VLQTVCTAQNGRLRTKDTGNKKSAYFDVLLTVHLSIFISVFNQFDAQNLFHNNFYFMPLHVYNTCVCVCVNYIMIENF